MRVSSQSTGRRVSQSARAWFLYTGCLATATVVSLVLLLYCFPPKQQLSKESTSAPWREGTGDISSESKGAAAQVDAAEQTEFTAARERLEESVASSGPALEPETSASGCEHGQCRNGSSNSEDFVFAIATHEFNEPALKAGRAGRVGLHTYISTNYTPTEDRPYPSIESETWGFYPDDRQLRSFYVGDTRAALVPFLAYRDLGDTFKWVFYGDDDTLFFVDAAMKLVKDLDPEMPYFLTDHFWFSNWNYGYPWHPHWRAPRCLPCFSDVDTSTLRMGMAKACPCTPQDMCNLEGGYDNILDNRTCTPPRAPTLTYSMHGGAGALISIGLLKKVSLEEMERCALREWNTGGDSFITTCLWQAGYGMTDPGPLWHPDGLTRFDPTPRRLIIDHTNYVIPRSAFAIGNLVAKAAGLCEDDCKLEMDHFISLHIRSRLLTNTSHGAAVLLRGVARFYSLQTGRIQSGVLDDTDDPAAASLAAAVDKNFTAGVKKLQLIVPHLQEVAKQQIKWPMNGAAALFIPSKIPLNAGPEEEVELSAEDMIKGAAAGIAQNLLEDALQEALLLYPPPSQW